MAKKVRVYRYGGEHCAEGHASLPNRQLGGEPAMTQDSKQDSIHREKTQSFIEWLSRSNEKAVMNQQLENDKIFNELVKSRGGRENQKVIAPYQSGGFVDEESFKGDPNFRFFARNFYDQNQGFGNLKDDLGTLRSGLTDIAGQPKEFKYEGDFQPFLEGYNQQGYGAPQFDDLKITGVNKSGLFGRNRTLDYDVTGTQYPVNNTAPPDLFKGQQGASIPGNDIWNMDIFRESYGAPAQPNGHLPIELQSPPQSGFLTGEGLRPGPGAVAVGEERTSGPQQRTINESGNIELQRQGRFKQALEEQPYLGADLFNAGLSTASYLAEGRDRGRAEDELRQRVSNVHNLFGTQGENRGDYMVNLPGVGDFLQPDRHTRSGFDTKVARDGYQMQGGGEYNVEDEVDLTEEQIQKLVAQGYEVEYLD